MSKPNIKKPYGSKKKQSVLNLSHSKARDFFIKHERYCNFDLPPYILFDPILKKINSFLTDKPLSDFYTSNCRPQNEDKINHTILHNKDGKYAWRPIQLIHPALYVSLVHSITEMKHWKIICGRFKKFEEESHIKCMSIPVTSPEKKKPNLNRSYLGGEKLSNNQLKCLLIMNISRI